ALEHFKTLPSTSHVRDYAGGRVMRALHYQALYQSAAQATSTPPGQLLADSLRAKAVREGFKALQATALLSERDSIALAIENLKSNNPAQRANALETLDSSREKNLIRPLLALWETGEASSLTATAGDLQMQVLQDADGWLRACAALTVNHSAD